MENHDEAILSLHRNKMLDLERRWVNALEQLNDDDVNWRANDVSNSIANLVIHVVGSLRQRFVSGIGGEPDNRDRDDEFNTKRSDRLQLMFTPSGRVGWLAIIAGAMNSNQTLQLWRTLDSGAHWALMSNKNPTDFLLGLQNAQYGWAECAHAGEPPAIWLKEPVHSPGFAFAEPVLYHTTDGGHTWKPQYLPVPDTLTQYNGHVSLGNTVWFGDEGFIPVSFTSDHPNMKWGVYVTKNGGDTWHLYMENAVANNYGSNMTQVNFSIVSPTDLFEAVTTLHETNNGPYLAKSTYLYYKSAPDQRWMKIGVGETPEPFIQVQFISRKVGFALTQAGVLYKTLNGGHDWRTMG